MSNHKKLTNELLTAYRDIIAVKEKMPEWAVHKRNFDKLVVPTIPFVGKDYAKQEKKF